MPTTTPNMSLVVPTPSVDTGPGYATNASAALTAIDGHDHTGAPLGGKQLGAAALNIDGDVSMHSNDLASVRSVEFDNQGTVLSGVGDVDCVYVKGGDLYYNNGAGTAVQVTSGAAVNAPGTNTVDKLRAVSGNITILSTDTDILYAVDTSVARSITLPLLSQVAQGRTYIFIDITGASSTNKVTASRSGSDVFDNGGTSASLASNWGVMRVWAAPNQWKVSNSFNSIVGTIGTGTNPARSGAIGMSQNQAINFRDGSDSGDRRLISSDASDNVFLGNTFSANSNLQAATSVNIQPGGSTKLSVTSSGASVTGVASASTAVAIGANPASAGSVRLSNGGSVLSRNNANSADITAISVGGGATDRVEVGDTTNTAAVLTRCNSSGSVSSLVPSAGEVTCTSSESLLAFNGTAKVRVNTTGVGFYGTAGTAKQTVTGSRGGNAALASLLTALATIGLITDSSTA